jgi:diacylglycerol kinase family enzyme
MIRRRSQRTKNAHYLLIANESADNFDSGQLDALIGAIRDKSGQYTVIRTDSAEQSMQMASATLGLKRGRRPIPMPVARRGKVTAVIAAGGDGTVNLAGQLAAEAALPLGILPMGHLNNIARSLFDLAEPAVDRIMAARYKKIDTGQIGPHIFLGGIGFGFVPSLARLLADRRPPRLGISWSKLGGQAAAGVQPKPLVIKIDSFRFEVSPLMLSINLLPHIAGLPLSPASVDDDGQAEVIFDRGDQIGEFSGFTRLIVKRKYYFGDAVRLYRGRVIKLLSTAGREMYIDGDIVASPSDELPVTINEKQLKIFC